MDKIREKLKDKNFDERALNYICNFIEEFDSLFGKYVSKEEIIKRIVNNLNNFEFGCDFSSSRVNGRYSGKEIKLSKNIDNGEEKIKSVIFHEMIHCITYNSEELVTGFSKKYFWVEDYKQASITITMHGFTEGFTEYVTKIRDNKYLLEGRKIISYPILTEQVQNIALLIGEDRFLDIGFNNPQDFIEEMQLEYGDTIDFPELEYLFEAFDIIWKEEDKIYRQINRRENPARAKSAIDMIFGIFDTNINEDSKELKLAKNNIIMVLEKIAMAKPVTTIEEFNQLYDTVSRYTNQLNSSYNIKMYELLLEKLKELQNNNLSSEGIIEKIDSEDFRIYVRQENYINSIKELTNQEKLMKFSNPETKEEMSQYNFFKDTLFGSEQRAKLSDAIIQTDSIQVGEELLYILQNGLAEKILKNNWNLDKIGLDCIKLDFFKTVFNLYETSISEKTYLGTYGVDDNGDFEEYTHCISNEKREKILQEDPEFADMLLLESQNGNVIGYAGDDQYIDYDGAMGQAEYCKSKEEKILENLKSRSERVRRLKELGAPEAILDTEIEIVKIIIDKLKEIEGENSVILEKIGQLSTDSSEQDVFEIMEKITTKKLGLEVLEVEKDYNRLDNVEAKMNEHLKQHEKTLENETIDKKINEIFG